MKVAYFDLTTGKITCVMQATNLNAFPLPSSTEDRVFLMTNQDMPGYVDGGLYFVMPPQLSTSHTWNWTTKTWDLDLTLAKAQAHVRIKQARSTHEFAPFAWGGYVFDGDERSRGRLSIALVGAKEAIELGEPWAEEWKLADDTTVSLNATQMVEVYRAHGQKMKFAHNTAGVLAYFIDTATTLEQLEAIQWPGVVV